MSEAPKPHEYTLSDEAQRIVVAAREAPQWDTTRDRLTSRRSRKREAMSETYICERCGRRVHGGDHVCPGSPGDLIPLADHRLAVALAYQRAADVIWTTKDEDDWNYWGFGADEAAGRSALIAAKSIILALADSDPLAEAQALRAERDRFERALEDIADGMGETEFAEIGRFAPVVARAALQPKVKP